MYGRPGAAVPNSRTLRHGCPLVRLVGEVDNQAGQVQVRAIAMRCDLGPPWLLGYILPRYVRSGLHEAAFVNRTERRVGARLSRAQDVVDCVAFPRSSPAGSRPGCIFYIGADVGNLPFCRVPVSMRRGFKSCAPWRSRHTPGERARAGVRLSTQSAMLVQAPGWVVGLGHPQVHEVVASGAARYRIVSLIAFRPAWRGRMQAGPLCFVR